MSFSVSSAPDKETVSLVFVEDTRMMRSHFLLAVGKPSLTAFQEIIYLA